MEPFPFSEESSLHLEIPLPAFPGSPVLPPSPPGPPPAAAPPDALELGLSALSLCPGRDWDVEHGLGLPGTADDGGGAGDGRGGGFPCASPLPCGCCGTVLGGTSAGHGLTHGQRHPHGCPVRGKAFKRHNHLSGHALSPQKRKLLACPERGCARTCCDLRSLRRHREHSHRPPAPPHREDPPELCPTDPGGPTGSAGTPRGCPNVSASPGEGLEGSAAPAPVDAPFTGTEPCPRVSLFPAQSSQQWLRNTRSSAPEGSAGPALPFPQPCELQDALPFPLVPSGSEEVALGCPEDSTGPWDSVVEEVTPGDSTQLFLRAPECPEQSLLQEQEQEQSLLQVQEQEQEQSLLREQEQEQSLLQAIAASQQILSQVLHAAPLHAVLQPLPPPAPPEPHSLPHSLPHCQGGAPADREAPGPPDFQAAELKDPTLGGGAVWDPLESAAVPGRRERSRDSDTGRRPRSWRVPGARREKLAGTASPSQVAMASFAPRLAGLSRVQGGSIYGCTSAVRDDAALAPSNKSSAVPTDGSKGESVFLCKNCTQLFYTQRGLQSHMCFRGEQWLLPPHRGEQQVRGVDNGSAPRPPPAAEAPLVIPVSVPVTAGDKFVQVAKKESLDGKNPAGSLHPKKRKRQILPKSLFIPPPPSSEAQPGPGGGRYQSHLRSPVFLVEHLLRDLLQGSPYTPPPMLSPIREGSGLYFNAVCAASAGGDPGRLFGTALDRMDQDFGLRLMKDGTKISIEPHINVGSRFQAEIPSLQDRSHLDSAEQAAALVWKPWGDIATNEETQDRVMKLLNMACSSVMPGGGTNLELALHCLHEAQGDIVEALELLLFGWPQKSESHPLANYRYTGSDVWTPVERQLFRAAFCAHKKDFFLIQKKVQTKNVSQCVEYYYIWKKTIRFDCSRTQAVEKRTRRDSTEVEEAEEKSLCPPKKRHRLLPKDSIKQKSCRKMPPGAGSPSCGPGPPPGEQQVFPCRECERVFDKIKGRNAHMKRHRLQRPAGPLPALPWPLEPLKMEPEVEGEQPGGRWGAVLSE